MKKINKKVDYTKPTVITIAVLLVIALSIWGIIYFTTERVTARNISNYLTLGNYIGVEYEPLSLEVSDEEVEERINGILAQAPIYTEITDRAVQNGDLVIIDYIGSLDGVPFPGGADNDAELRIGSGQFIPGFEEQIIGHFIGDEFDIFVTFPEDYHAEDLAGQDTVFGIVLREILSEVIPELTDEYVREISEDSTVAEYRATIRRDMEEERVRDSENHRRNAVWEAIVEDTVVHKLPKAERDTAIDNMILEHRTYAQMVGMSSLAELAMEWSGMTEAEYINEEIIPFAESGVKQDLTLRAIAFAEGFSISNADYRAGVTRFTEEFDYESESAFIEANGEDMIRIALLADKVMNFIVDNAIAK